MGELITELCDRIEKKGLTIKFGLEQQGHIPKIEKLLKDFGDNDYAWKLIGGEIGWDWKTARKYYQKYLEGNKPTPEQWQRFLKQHIPEVTVKINPNKGKNE